jgi:multidrug efflux system membrane fusion protein
MIGLCLLTVVLWCQADAAPASPGSPEAVPVTAAMVRQETVPVQVQAIGTVEAYATIAVKSLVSGQLLQVHFTEGQAVHRGDLLFTIDPKPLQATLRQAEANLAKDLAGVKLAEANLAKDTAQANYAEMQARRYQHLATKGVVSKEDYDQRRTNADVLAEALLADRAAIEDAKALVRADRAAVDNAKLQLTYCFIHTPIDGRTGPLLVNQGNVVKANDTVLVVIDQVQPIYVTFAVPEQELPEIERYARAAQLQVEATIPGDEARRARGILTFIDNAVDTTTGTIRLKGTFANHDTRLWPGQFVQVALTLTTQPHAVVVPSQAIQTGQQGTYVFVITPDLTVVSRGVEVNRAFDGNTVIKTGLQPGERVVTDGQLRLVPGARVVVKNSLQSAPESKQP